MPVINRSKHTWIVSRVNKADSIWSRIIGWIGRCQIDPEEALWVKPCWGVHTFGMKFPIDAVFLGKDNRVLEIVSNLAINRLSPLVFRAKTVLVLPAHSIEESRTVIGDFIEITESEIFKAEGR